MKLKILFIIIILCIFCVLGPIIFYSKSIQTGYYTRIDEGVTKTIQIIDEDSGILYNIKDGIKVTYSLKIENGKFYNSDLGTYKFTIKNNKLTMEILNKYNRIEEVVYKLKGH
jgi:hypothetical protein